jgi:hypothetical protein
MSTFDQLPAPRSMRTQYKAALRQELEAAVGVQTQRRRWFRGQFGSWTHRAVVIAVAAAIVVVFFVPLPHVSLFHSLVAPAKTTPASTPTVISAKVSPTAVTGTDGYLWMLGTYPCPTGSCPVLMRSSDGGKSFVRVGTPPPDLYGIEFANRQDGYAYSAGNPNDRLYWTGDGGKSWQLALSQFRSERSSAVAIASGRAYALVPEDCSTYICKSFYLASSAVTTDAWITRRLPVDTANSLVSMTAFRAKIWLIVTSDGGSKADVVVSEDGGRSFASVPSTGMLGLGCSATAVSATTLWGFCPTGNFGYGVRSTDGGRVFTSLPGTSAPNGSSILPVSENEAVFQDETSTNLWLTRDGGSHFSAVLRFPETLSGVYVAFASKAAWLVLGIPATGSDWIWHTTNGGHTWQRVKAPTVSIPLPVVDLSATPKGWTPVAYGDAQISVPASWHVLYDSSACLSGSPAGDVYVNPSGGFCSAKGTPKGKTTIMLVSVNPNRYQPPTSYGQRLVINGLPVYALYSFVPTPNGGSYLVPSLGVEIEIEGPLATRVVDTLSRSPRIVALASGPAPTVPSSWRSVTFAGLQFSVPADWPMNRTQTTPNLGGSDCQAQSAAFFRTVVTLSTDTFPLIIATCLYSPPTLQSPPDAVQVDSGSRWASSAPVSLSKPPVAFSKHCLDLNGLTACPATSPAYSILVLKVTVPGRSNPVYVSIGLAGNGMVARTILYSLRASSAIGHPFQIAGTIAGTLVRVGGPSPGTPVALPGQVTARSSAGRKFTVTVGKSGRFVLSVSPGVYKLTGLSPLVSQETCMATKPVRVKMEQRVSGVEVICSIS